ncbi:MAG: 16S rRNA (uracil(1498)-N(3))-methyltransferase [Kiritimatiellales bacterium]|nr:16S rRNA (uracil(1498)-N(3))-methyltransferase [Kiritimatiellales bacterium]
MNLILISPEEAAPDNVVQLTDGRAAHIRTVLRAEPGKTLRIGLLNGPFGAGTVEQISEESVTLSCVWEAALPPRPPIDLLLAMPRPKVLKRLWAQFAALGVGRIFITNAEKVEKYYFDTHVLDPDFYNARLIEGLQQARDTRLPEVTIVRRLCSFLENDLGAVFPRSEKKLLADPSGTQTIFQCLEKSVENFPSIGTRVLLAIGPEGGWTPYELEMLQAHGFEVFGMGSRILRADTACIALLSQLSLCSSLK